MVYVLAVVVVALFIALLFAGKKTALLDAKVNELKYQLANPVPKPFGLAALELVGRALGGLTDVVAHTAYVVAAACERPNTVADDVAGEQGELIITISQGKMEIENLQERIRDTEYRLSVNGRRADTLGKIAGMLPK